jgi:hypothetical protein
LLLASRRNGCLQHAVKTENICRQKAIPVASARIAEGARGFKGVSTSHCAGNDACRGMGGKCMGKNVNR